MDIFKSITDLFKMDEFQDEQNEDMIENNEEADYDFHYEYKKGNKISQKETLEERNKSKLAYEFLYSYYSSNKDNFDIKNKDNNTTILAKNKREGIVSIKGEETHIYIPTRIAREILRLNNFPQIDSYKIEWKENGFTKCENNRYDKSNLELGRHFHFVYVDINKEKNNVSQ